MAQYAVLIYAGDSAHSAHATSEDTAPHDRHAEELERSGALVAAYALTTRDLATSVRGDVVTDGPFVDAKEIVAGFYILEAPDLDAALAIARLNPACHAGGGVEVRPIAGGGFVEHPA
ncbi:YciI family protein [Catellatospora sp. NPDC049111]|uniref:YciI family protein n=1 Tax=Catellatospora sp. NPDC049111 TaxID=3155271 RepID=UPI0033E923EF